MPHYYLGYLYKERGEQGARVRRVQALPRLKPDADEKRDIEAEIEDLGGGALRRVRGRPSSRLTRHAPGDTSHGHDPARPARARARRHAGARRLAAACSHPAARLRAGARSRRAAAGRAAAAVATQTLTLDQALQLAAERNLDLEGRRGAAPAGAAGVLEGAGRATCRPSPRAARTPATRTRRRSLPACIRREPRVPRSSIVPKDQLAGQVDVTQVLFSPALWFGIRAASSGADVARADGRRTRGARHPVRHRPGVLRRRGAPAGGAGLGAAPRDRAAPGEGRAGPLPGRDDREGRPAPRRDRPRARRAGPAPRAELLRVGAHRASRRCSTVPPTSRSWTRRSRRSPAAPRAARGGGAPGPDRRPAPRAAPATPRAPPTRAQLSQYLPNLAAFGHYQNAERRRLHRPGAPVGRRVSSLQWKLLDGGLREAEVREASARVDETEANVASAEARVAARGPAGAPRSRERARQRREGEGAARARRGEPAAGRRLLPRRRGDRRRAGRRHRAAPERRDRPDLRGARRAARRAARPPGRGRERSGSGRAVSSQRPGPGAGRARAPARGAARW